MPTNLSKLFLFIFLAGLPGYIGLKAQTLQSSNLPIILIITDNGSGIPSENKIGATMKVIRRPDGSRNYVSDQNTTEFIEYNGRIGIEVRGSTSSILPKKPYGFETRLADNKTSNNVSLLGMPAENDWVLNALAYDASLIRDHLSYQLYRDMGQYGPRSRYCELILNGAYQGLYLLTEKLKGDDDRINIHEMTKTDVAGIDLTGGYIVKADKADGDPVSWSMPGPAGTTSFIHHEPEPEDITSAQKAYIMDQFMKLRDLADVSNENIQNGYPSVIDVHSFIDFMLINELAANVDAYQFSTYFHKDKGGKLRAGPVWDFNLTYGNDLFFWGLNRSFTFTWQFDNGDNTGPFFWRKLYASPGFKCHLAKRWKQLTATGEPLELRTVLNKIDQIIELTAEAAQRENLKWNSANDRSGNISAMKSWLSERYSWINNQLPNFNSCANPQLPSLVISRINFNPAGVNGGELEFIEITNASQSPVNTTGLYFREPGISYNFPVNGTIAAGEKIYLASNATSFEQFYGPKAFGTFVRNLDNDSQRLVIADAFGNIVDEVHYRDSGVWPSEADGAGAFLQLKDIASDNSMASSWIASKDCFFKVPAPSVVDVGFCLNAQAAPLVATSSAGNSLRWYQDLSGGTPLAGSPVPSTAAVGNIDYFVSAVNPFGCESDRQKVNVTISQKPPQLQIELDLSDPSAPLFSSSSYTAYQWFLNEVLISGANDRTYQAVQNGRYQVAGVNQGCVGLLSSPIDLIITGINLDQRTAAFIYPNPASERVAISFPDESNAILSYAVHDLNGKPIISGIGSENPFELNMGQLTPGLYVLRIYRENQSYLLKLLKRDN